MAELFTYSVFVLSVPDTRSISNTLPILKAVTIDANCAVVEAAVRAFIRALVKDVEILVTVHARYDGSIGIDGYIVDRAA